MVRPTMFRNKINPKKPPLKKARAIAKQQVNMKRDEEQEQRRRRKQLQKLKKTAAKLKKMGVEYSVDLQSIEKEILDVNQTRCQHHSMALCKFLKHLSLGIK